MIVSNASERQATEKDFHNRKYAVRHSQASNADFLASSTWDPWKDPNLLPILQQMPRQPSLLLELGCGPGIASLALALQGHLVTFTDISGEAVLMTRQRLKANQVLQHTLGVITAAENLPFLDNLFDFVSGVGVLHHLDLSLARSEILRVMKPGASAVFVEPLGENILLNIVRDLFTKHTPDERMLTYSDLDLFCEGFQTSRITEFQLFSMLRLVGFPSNLVQRLERLDSWLSKRSATVRRMCRLVSIVVVK